MFRPIIAPEPIRDTASSGRRQETVQVRRRISKRIRRSTEGINLAADVNADVSINVAERGQRRVPPPPSKTDAKSKERGKETQ
jgi:hypothetical protein